MIAPLHLTRREPIHDVHPLTGISFEVFYTARWKHSAGEALVSFSGFVGAFTGWSGNWPVRYELLGVSARDKIADAGHLLMHERFANRTSPSMCHACDMKQPTLDDTWLESLVFTGIF